jgi:hypothetical protein
LQGFGRLGERKRPILLCHIVSTESYATLYPAL